MALKFWGFIGGSRGGIHELRFASEGNRIIQPVPRREFSLTFKPFSIF